MSSFPETYNHDPRLVYSGLRPLPNVERFMKRTKLRRIERLKIERDEL